MTDRTIDPEKVAAARAAGIPEQHVEGVAKYLRGETPEEWEADAAWFNREFYIQPATDPSQGHGMIPPQTAANSTGDGAAFLLQALHARY